ncbi:phospholipase D-like domain-containing protein [Burkholderia guangdongensis]|uniref:phospholipase D-like domain-containing protein n=1 Tax=Burkholderia guangdongensis TaxID=1792500 RepID=UPI0015C884A4|nr:phospholipase D-like domain-containing protein [Burkholderia guangdongensis]
MKSAACLCAALVCAASAHAVPMPPDSATVGTYLSRDDAATDAATGLIRQARHRVLVAGYAHLPPALADALRAAHARGVDVRVVLNRATRPGRGARSLASGGIDVAIGARDAAPGMRFVIVDDSVALAADADNTQPGTGMVNVFHRAPELAQTYGQTFWRLYWQADRL